jgi:hypothetical protein
LAEILEFVMGKGLIPADGEIWRVRRRAIVPALHKKVTQVIYGFGVKLVTYQSSHVLVMYVFPLNIFHKLIVQFMGS